MSATVLDLVVVHICVFIGSIVVKRTTVSIIG